MLYVQRNKKIGIEKMPFELVERKGVGHPDTLCDAIAEKASQYYARYFYDEFGGIAHHWFDKVMLVGGCSCFTFGEGELIRPYKVIFAGKAAKTYAGKEIPLDFLLRKAACDVLSEHLTGFDEKKHIVIQNEIEDYHGAGRNPSRYQPKNLEDLYVFGRKNIVSNDCNLLSGYAPLSLLEQLVLNIERYINGVEFKKKHPATGWDVKIIGYRENDVYFLTINIPFIAALVKSQKEYFEIKEYVYSDINKYVQKLCDKMVHILINPQDKNKRFYLTVLGSVADTGDIGVVGRGNRINGIITPMRGMSIEAPAGKNPIDHTGKLYGILTHRLSEKLSKMLNTAVEINLFTSKEAELDKPDHLSIAITDWDENNKEKMAIENIVYDALDNIEEITKELVFDGITLW